MKKIKTAIFFINIIILSSCSDSHNSFKAIPKETGIILAVDFHSMLKKAGIEMAENKWIKNIKREVRNEDIQSYRILNDILENPKITGINFRNDFFAYHFNEGIQNHYVVFTAEVSEKEKVEDFLKKIFRNFSEERVYFDENKSNNYSFITLDDAGFAWDDEKIIFVGELESRRKNNNIEFVLEDLMTLKKENSISNQGKFKNFIKNKKDISIWLSSNMIENFPEIIEEMDLNEIINSGILEYEDLLDNYVSLDLEFGDNDISLIYNQSINEKLEKRRENILTNNFNQELFSFFTEKSLVTISTSVDPINMIKQIEEEIFPSLEKNYQLLNDEEKGKYKNNFEKGMKEQYGVTTNELFKTLKGSFMFSLFDFKNVEYTYKTFGKKFIEEKAEKVSQYNISLIHRNKILSFEEKEILNSGGTIMCEGYKKDGKYYCANILNVLKRGGDINEAIENDELINFYLVKDKWQQGEEWEWGRYGPEKTITNVLPMMSLAFDITENEAIKKMIIRLANKELSHYSLFGNTPMEDYGDYYEFKFTGMYPAYLAFDEKYCLITSDKKSAKNFKKGGFVDSFKNNSLKDEIEKASAYAFCNLDYYKYPKQFIELVEEDLDNKVEKEMFNVWVKDFLKNAEVSFDKNSTKIKLNIKEEKENSLNTIITNLNDIPEEIFY